MPKISSSVTVFGVFYFHEKKQKHVKTKKCAIEYLFKICVNIFLLFDFLIYFDSKKTTSQYNLMVNLVVILKFATFCTAFNSSKHFLCRQCEWEPLKQIATFKNVYILLLIKYHDVFNPILLNWHAFLLLSAVYKPRLRDLFIPGLTRLEFTMV